MNPVVIEYVVLIKLPAAWQVELKHNISQNKMSPTSSRVSSRTGLLGTYFCTGAWLLVRDALIGLAVLIVVASQAAAQSVCYTTPGGEVADIQHEKAQKPIKVHIVLDTQAVPRWALPSKAWTEYCVGIPNEMRNSYANQAKAHIQRHLRQAQVILPSSPRYAQIVREALGDLSKLELKRAYIPGAWQSASDADWQRNQYMIRGDNQLSRQRALSPGQAPFENDLVGVLVIKGNWLQEPIQPEPTAAPQPEPKPTPTITLTRQGPSEADKLRQQQAGERAQVESERAEREAQQRFAQARAKDEAAKLAREAQDKERCLAQGKSNSCACLRFFPSPPPAPGVSRTCSQ